MVLPISAVLFEQQLNWIAISLPLAAVVFLFVLWVLNKAKLDNLDIFDGGIITLVFAFISSRSFFFLFSNESLNSLTTNFFNFKEGGFSYAAIWIGFVTVSYTHLTLPTKRIV